MPGTVIKVFFQPGENVKKNDTMVIIEAMKMEHAVKAA